LESESNAELVECGVDVTKRRMDGVVVKRRATRAGLSSECGEWAEQTGAELDQQHAELGALRSETIATRAAEALDQSFGAQLGQVVAKLAEAIVVVGEAVARQDARLGLPSVKFTG
jgi:hypothetical protein